MYKIKLGGIAYEVTEGKDGKPIYNPPLPKSRVKADKEKFDEICRTGTCPGLRTDTNFHAGRGTILDQMDGDVQWTKFLVQEAKRQGYTPGVNDVYIGQLAENTGDPNGWFKPGEGRSEVIKRAKKLGKGIEAPGISVKAKPYEEKQGPLLNEFVTKNLMKEYKKTGEARSMDDRELRAHVKAKHGRSLSA